MAHWKLRFVLVRRPSTDGSIGRIILLDGADFKGVYAGRVACLILITDCGRYAGQLQPSAGSTGPSICGRSIAFDLSAAAAFAGAHH